MLDSNSVRYNSDTVKMLNVQRLLIEQLRAYGDDLLRGQQRSLGHLLHDAANELIVVLRQNNSLKDQVGGMQ